MYPMQPSPCSTSTSTSSPSQHPSIFNTDTDTVTCSHTSVSSCNYKMSVIQAAEETWTLFKELDYNEFKHIYRIFDALKGVMAVYTRGEREELYAANLWAER